eukprot:12896348-Alexandrium_andersonii.AAC.1
MELHDRALPESRGFSGPEAREVLTEFARGSRKGTGEIKRSCRLSQDSLRTITKIPALGERSCLDRQRGSGCPHSCLLSQ